MGLCVANIYLIFCGKYDCEGYIVMMIEKRVHRYSYMLLEQDIDDVWWVKDSYRIDVRDNDKYYVMDFASHNELGMDTNEYSVCLYFGGKIKDFEVSKMFYDIVKITKIFKVLRLVSIRFFFFEVDESVLKYGRIYWDSVDMGFFSDLGVRHSVIVMHEMLFSLYAGVFNYVLSYYRGGM